MKNLCPMFSYRFRLEIKKIILLLVFLLFIASQNQYPKVEQQIVKVKVGDYSQSEITGLYMGLMNENGSTIGQWDNVESFNNPNHNEADFLWFSSGSIAWDFPLDIPSKEHLTSLQFIAELASEAPGANWEWPSDVILSINDIDVGIWTLPGDPDGRYGLANQKNHLPPSATQYGWLITWTINKQGTFVQYQSRLDEMPKMKVSDITLGELQLIQRSMTEFIEVKLTVPENIYTYKAHGINVFGHSWGDYDKDPTLVIEYIK